MFGMDLWKSKRKLELVELLGWYGEDRAGEKHFLVSTGDELRILPLPQNLQRPYEPVVWTDL